MTEIRHSILALGIVLAAALPLAVQSESLTPPQDLQRAAEALLRHRIPVNGADEVLVTAAPLDARLRLPQCTAKLEAFLPAGAQPAARTTVGVRCVTPYWTVYVPVSVETRMNVLVLRHAAPRLAVVEAADVEVQPRRVPGFPTIYVTDVSALAGRHLRMPVAPGMPLTVDQFANDLIVKRGQRVTLLSAAGGIEVRAPGEAIADASADGRVRVQNLASRRVVEGVAESADSVRVGSP
jgi:flagella basal body P-ring formation protein FlgA